MVIGNVAEWGRVARPKTSLLVWQSVFCILSRLCFVSTILTAARLVACVNIIDFAGAIRYIWWGVGLVLGGCVFSSVYSRLCVAQKERIARHCGSAAVSKIFGAEPSIKLRFAKQKVISILTQNTDAVVSFSSDLTDFFGAVAEFVFVCAILLWANFLLGLVVIGISVLCLLFYCVLVALEDRATRALNATRDKRNQAIEDIIEGAPLAFDLNIENEVFGGYSLAVNNLLKISRRETRLTNARRLWLGFVYSVLAGVATLYMLNLLRLDYLTLTVFLFCWPYLNSMLNKTMNCYLIVSQAKNAATSAARLNYILSLNQKSLIRLGQNTNDILKGNLIFNDVSLFGGATAVLKHFNFSAAPKTLNKINFKTDVELDAFIGLLRRTKMPTEGTIVFDNISIYDFSKSAYAHNLTIVEDPYFFEGTILDNLKMVGAGRRMIYAALKFVGAKAKIAELPQGLLTNAKELESFPFLKIKLNIARALLTRAEVIIFNEFKSFNLPEKEQKEVEDLIEKIAKTKTVVWATSSALKN